MERSAATECWVGLVLSSPDGPIHGTSETCRKKTLSRPISCRTWRAASRNGQRLDVTDGAADLGDDDVDVVGPHGEDAVLDLVGDVRDHLDRVAEVVAAALLGDHRRVDLPGRDVGDLAQVGVQEPLVVTDVEVGLRPVVGDEHLAVLERVHRPGVDVEVGVELLHGHAQPPRAEQAAQAGGGQSLAEGRGDATGDEDVLGRLRCYQQGSPWARMAPGDGPRGWLDVLSSTGFEPTNDSLRVVPRAEFNDFVSGGRSLSGTPGPSRAAPRRAPSRCPTPRGRPASGRAPAPGRRRRASRGRRW